MLQRLKSFFRPNPVVRNHVDKDGNIWFVAYRWGRPISFYLYSQMSENVPRELDLEKDYSEEFYGTKPGARVIDKGTVSGDEFARMLGI